LNLDDGLMREAARLTGLRAKTDVVHEGLRALITRESARRLAALGGKLLMARAPRRPSEPTPLMPVETITHDLGVAWEAP
jgi:Arc/MetJ family transcription regulator